MYWHTNPWGECTACQEYRTREVSCRKWSAGVVSQSGSFSCSGTPPATSQDCNAGCAWHTGEWSECTAYCGGASRWRSVTCPTADSSACGDQPAASESCEHELTSNEMAAACPWVVGQWTPEDCECGVWQSRTVSCAATGRVGEALSEDMCAQWAPKPQDERPCGCWEPSDWEECSCSGVQSRTVSCTGSSCAEPAPAVEQTCDPICEWEVGVWSACVGACGSGERTRTVRCPEDGACAGLPVPDVEECEAPWRRFGNMFL